MVVPYLHTLPYLLSLCMYMVVLIVGHHTIQDVLAKHNMKRRSQMTPKNKYIHPPPIHLPLEIPNTNKDEGKSCFTFGQIFMIKRTTPQTAFH